MAAAVLAALIVGLLWGAVSLYRAPIFVVENFVVSGERHYDKRSILKLARVPANATLLQIRTGAVAKRLESDPWIAEAKVTRDFPDTLRISIRERLPVAIVDGGGDRMWAVSSDGRWLGPRSAEDTGLVLIRDVDGVSPRAGAVVTEPEIINAVKVVQGISSELLAQVALVSAPTVDETALLTRGDVEIFVGEATEIDEKDRVIRAILKEQRGRVVYINVRVLDRPTWRGLEP